MRKIIIFSLCFLNLFSITGRDTTLIKIMTSPVPIRHMCNINGKIIMARYDGIFEFDGKSFKESKVKFEEVSASLSKNETWAKLADPKMDFAQVQLSNEGIYWVLIRNKFLFGFRVIDKIKKLYPDYSIRGIYSNGDDIFVSTYNGFFLNNKQIFKDTLSFSNSNFWIDKDWIYFSANLEDNVYRVDKQFSNLETVIPGKITKQHIRNLAGILFFNGYFYLGGQNGFGKYSKKSGFEIIDKNIDVSNIHIIKGKLWLACSDGAYLLEGDKPVKKFSIGSTGLFLVNDKILSTSFQGLWEYDFGSDKITNIFKGTMYEDIETDALYADQFGNYWISSIDGILKYNLKDKIITTILEGTEFNRRSYMISGDTLFFGSNNNGLISFDIENMISDDVMNSTETKNKENKLMYFIFSFLLIGLLGIFFIIRRQKVNFVANDKAEIKKDSDKLFATLEVFIKENINDVNVDQIRYRSGLTKYAFYTKFQAYFGKKPKELIAEIKEQIAVEKQEVIKNKK